MKTLLLLQFLFALSHSTLPPTFSKCNRKQSDFTACFKDAVNNAVKQLDKSFDEIGLPNFDPLEIPSFSISPSDGAAGFSQEYHNFKVYGISKCSCDEVKMNFDVKKLTAKGVCPEFRLVFDYEFKGKILVLPFSGKGPGNITLVKPQIDFAFDLAEREKKGKKYYTVTENSFKMHPEKLIFKFENIFGEDKAVSDNINQVFNDNWDVMYDDVRGSYESVMAQVVRQLMERMFAKVPVEELFGEE